MYYPSTLYSSVDTARVICYVKNIGTKVVRVVQYPNNKYYDVQPGETALVSIDNVGTGSNPTQIRFDALYASDSLDFIAWNPIIYNMGDSPDIPDDNDLSDLQAIRLYIEIFLFGLLPLSIAIGFIVLICWWFYVTFIRV
jgi:hypothetical protein